MSGPIARRLALASVLTAAFAVGCAASGQVDPTGAAGAAGQAAGTSGVAGSGAAGSAGTTGTAGGACVGPPVVKAHWTIGRDATGPEITCAQAGATTVQLFMDKVHTQFSCDVKAGMSTDFLPGPNTPRVLLISGPTILSAGNLAPVTVPTCGVLDLGGLRFLVTPTGGAGSGGGAGTGGGGAGSGGSSGGAGSGGGTGTAGTGGAAGTGGGTGPCNAMPIFALHSCASPGACHDSNGTSANFNMSSVGWEKNLVGKFPKAGGASGLSSSCLAAGKPYLVAGSVPATGLFIDKLVSLKPVCGAQMPLIPPNLSASELDCVQRWANALTKP